MGIRKIMKLFKDGNVCVTGLRGRGKDILIGNVVVRRKKPYVSNCNYGGEWYPLDMEKLNCGCNTYKNFISGKLNYYKFPYPPGTDIYVSDVGVYFPSQFCNELNKQYPYMPVYAALSRQVGDDSNFHWNCQAFNRCWDKFREQSDTMLLCLWCKVICGIVIQKVRYYDKQQSCIDKVKPFKVNIPLIGSGATRYAVRLQKAQYEATHGVIKEYLLIYRNKSTYDTKIFKHMLLNGERSDNSVKIKKIV